ncbi:DUF6000 family protein [Aureivirga sp. CE67]|uniref:DUF6000 family protein n=1 Tax=Aureivirga sp. CE67 TaxID=1788983 RepID=UPI0018C9CA3E|nr:DUF6000 family protein [Aureivirga sp. CE67]
MKIWKRLSKKKRFEITKNNTYEDVFSSDVFFQYCISPFYMRLMNGIIWLMKEKEQISFCNKLLKATKNLSNKELEYLLLKLNWRYNKVAAWSIGLQGKTEFVSHFESILETKYTKIEHILVNLFFLQKEKSCKTILKFIHKQRKYLISNQGNHGESYYDFHWALSILLYCDIKYDTEYYKQLVSSNEWEDFLYYMEGKRKEAFLRKCKPSEVEFIHKFMKSLNMNQD